MAIRVIGIRVIGEERRLAIGRICSRFLRTCIVFVLRLFSVTRGRLWRGLRICARRFRLLVLARWGI